MFSGNEKNEIWKKLAELSQNAKADKKELIDLINANETLSKSDAAQASKKTSEYRNKAQNTLAETATAFDEVTSIKGNIERIFDNTCSAEVMLNETLEQQNEYLIKIQKIYESTSNIENTSTAAMDKINEILAERDEIDESFRDFQESITEGESNYERIQLVLNQTIAKKKEIDGFHQELFGFQNEDEHVNGKRHDLDNVYTTLKTQLSDFKNDINEQEQENNDYYTALRNETMRSVASIELSATDTFEKFIDESRERYDSTYKQIKDLIPEALTAGLSAAYDQKIGTEVIEGIDHKNSFVRSIWLLISISLMPFLFGAYRLQNTDLATVIHDMPNILAIILPVYFPVVWMAYSANKSYKLSKRLIEEYTHKGVLSKTFEGLSTQIKDIAQEDISAELRIKLLYNLVDVNSENPGKLISDYNKSDHPLMDALDKSAKLANSFEKLGKLPGFSALAKKVDKQITAGLKEKDEKLSQVINNMNKTDPTVGFIGDEAENDSGEQNKTSNI